MKKTGAFLWIFALYCASAAPCRALIPPCLPEHEDGWREGLETGAAAVATESKQQARRVRVAESKEKARKIESDVRQASMLRNIMHAYLHWAPQGRLALQRSGWVEVAFTGSRSTETDAILEKFRFLTLSFHGSDVWGIGAQLEPGSATGQFLALRDELYQRVKNAAYGSSGTNPEAAEFGLWACETEVILRPGSKPAQIFTEEQCHNLFS